MKSTRTVGPRLLLVVVVLMASYERYQWVLSMGGRHWRRVSLVAGELHCCLVKQTGKLKYALGRHPSSSRTDH